MIRYVFNILIKSVPFYFIFLYIQRTYPRQFNQIMVNISYNAIYVFSKLQIYIGKYIKQTKQFIDSKPEFKKLIDNVLSVMKKMNEVEYIKDGQVISKNYVDTIYEVPKYFTFMIITHYNSDNICSNKKIVYSQKDINTDLEISNIKFLLVEAILDDKKYKIDLKDENHNYYIVDNIFDRHFFTYYLINHYKEDKLTMEYIDLCVKENKFFIKIIDNSVKMLELNMSDINDVIQIKKDTFVRRVIYDNK